MGINEEKEKIRETIRAKRNALAAEDAEKLSNAVALQLLKLSRYNDAKTILFYAAKGNEVRTKSLIIKALRTGKKVLLPITNMAKEEIDFAEIRNLATDLKAGPFGIAEPKNKPTGEKEKIDIIIVPGLAFARDGHRVGYGLGFYDKLLPKLREMNPNIKKIGLAYNFQVLDNVPRNENDQRVDVVVTESSVIVSSEARTR